jgi:hypothetical protein
VPSLGGPYGHRIDGTSRQTGNWRRPVVSDDVWQRIEQARARRNVLDHPFYQSWSAGELSRVSVATA